jgi:uncharacterized protein (TIGR02611 family)
MAAEAPDPQERHRLLTSLEERRARHLERPKVIRLLVVLAGATVALAGVAMLVLPGPAFVVIPVGLALLALEFAWAERLLERAVDQAEKAKQKAGGLRRRRE